MPDVSSFSELAQEFDAVARKVVWPTMTTVDRQGRPRARIVHPVWDGPTGWLLTGRSSLKAKHLAQVPYISISYVDTEGVSPTANQAYAECRAEWIDDAAEKTRVRDLFKSLPEPYGYDPGVFFPAGPEDPDFGVLKLTPWRVEVFSLATQMQGQGKVWRQDV